MTADVGGGPYKATTAPTTGGATVAAMTRTSLDAKHQAATLAAAIRGRHTRPSTALESSPRRPLAEILPLVAPAPRLEVPPVTRAIGPTGRIRVVVGGRTLTELLGWEPGALAPALEGPWAVLRPSASPAPRRRLDGTCAYLEDGRLRVTSALCRHLGLDYGREVALLVCPRAGALALCDPARLLLGAPLDLVGDAGPLARGER